MLTMAVPEHVVVNGSPFNPGFTANSGTYSVNPDCTVPVRLPLPSKVDVVTPANVASGGRPGTLSRKPWTEHPYSPESVRFEQCRLLDWALADVLSDCATAKKIAPEASKPQRIIIGVVRINILDDKLVSIETSL